MYAAINKAKKLVYAINCQENEDYFCPKSTLPVVLIRTQKSVFFRHENQSSNEVNERDVHKHGKEQLKKYLQEKMSKKVQLEFYLKQIDQTPDVWVDDKIALEFQCAKLNVTKLSKRVTSYQKANIKNYWILGGNYLSHKPSKLHLKFLDYTKNWGFFIIMFDPEISQITLFYQIRFQGPFNKIVYQKKQFPIEKIKQLLEFKATFQPKYDSKISDYQIQKIRAINNPKVNQFKLDYYRRFEQKVEDFLLGRTLQPIKPIYQTHKWMIDCGVKPKRIRQPLLFQNDEGI